VRMPEVMHDQPVEAGRARPIRVHRALPSLVRDPLTALVDFGTQADGEVVRLNVGSFRPYLVTNPVHVQHILRDKAANYERAGDGLFWRPIRRLFGEGILGEGQIWGASRRILQPLFTAKRVEAMVDGMATAIGAAVDELSQPCQEGRSIDLGGELTRIVCQAMMRVLFADKISLSDAMRVVAAQDTIATAVLPRIAVPFAPLSLPMPGDRAFRNAVQIVDEVLLPVVREARRRRDDGDDVISTLCRARTDDGRELDERQVRNDTVAMFAATTETTINLLTWLFPHLHARPEVATRLQDEVDRVVGNDQVGPQHLPELRYTKMVLDELLRLYPIGWLIPRRAMAADVVGGVRVDAGATIMISPFITQRLTAYWDRPELFDPERFSPENVRRRHRYAHFPFGGGPHQCLGMYLFYLEAQLIVATLLTRFRVRPHDPAVPAPRLAASLRPRDKVEVTLLPRERTLASEEHRASA
jgi:cytochrome P450